MDWIGWIIVVAVLLWVGSKFGDDGSGHEDQNDQPRRNTSPEVQEIADKVTTAKQFEVLERKLEKAEERLSEVHTDRAYENACHKQEILQAAIDIAKWNVLQWQFIPDIEWDTPKKVLDHAYKVYSKDDYEALKTSLSVDGADWHEIGVYDEPDEPEPFLKPLIKFREIVESDEGEEEKIKKINRLVARNDNLAEMFFDSEDALTSGEQWFANELSNAGLPLAYELYREGYTTPEKCLEIDVEDFASRKGVGPKKTGEFKQFQAITRSNLNKIDLSLGGD